MKKRKNLISLNQKKMKSKQMISLMIIQIRTSIKRKEFKTMMFNEKQTLKRLEFSKEVEVEVEVIIEVEELEEAMIEEVITEEVIEEEEDIKMTMIGMKGVTNLPTKMTGTKVGIEAAINEVEEVSLISKLMNLMSLPTHHLIPME